ncbi:MAG: L,D-transpeptidase, partial [Synechococcus sp. CPC35]|nr:L,D-transpeptidase [Synechococcus sp. CPC35]
MPKRAMLPADIRLSVRAARSLVLAGLVMTLSGCGSDQQSVLGEPKLLGSIRIQLDASNPSASTGTVEIGDGPRQFKVGYGREGIACAGTTFQEGVTPLGTFRVNAILSDNDFAM